MYTEAIYSMQAFIYFFFVLQFLLVYTIKYCHPIRYECTSTANDGCMQDRKNNFVVTVVNFAHYRMTVLYVYVHLPICLYILFVGDRRLCYCCCEYILLLLYQR